MSYVINVAAAFLFLFSGTFSLYAGDIEPKEWNSLNNNVVALYRAGKIDEALPIAKKALDVAIQKYGHEHPYVSTSLSNLATLYTAKGDHPQVERMYNRALEAAEKALGSDHPVVATRLNDLASVYKYRGNVALAEPLFKRHLA